MAGSLTAIEVRKASHPGNLKGPLMLADGDGLYLQITPAGSKSWVLRYTLHGKARVMGLGTFGENDGGVSLANARGLAAQARSLLRDKRDPIEARKEAVAAERQRQAALAATAITFKSAAEDYIAAHSAEWKNEKHQAQWESTLKNYAYPVFGKLPIAEVDANKVEAVLKPLWSRVPETASRLRGRIEAILDFATARGWRSGDNPARWKESMKHRLPKVSKIKRQEHHPALPWQQIGAFMAELGTKNGMAAKALSFAILTAARSGEVRKATWTQMDLEAAIWTVPAEHMKAGKEHRVPLSAQAVAILKAIQPLQKKPTDPVFPSSKGGAMTDMALSMLVRGMNEAPEGEAPKWVDAKGSPVVPHGFRSTFRDWCEEATNTPRAVSEAALAHAVADKVEAAYRRTDLFERRVTLMREWGEVCAHAPQSRSAGDADSHRRDHGDLT